MNKHFKIFLMILLFFSIFVGLASVKAITDADCQKDAEQHGGQCGLNMRTCSTKADGSCGVNKHDEELWDAEKCAKSAKDSTSCAACSGYVWSESNGCVPANGNNASSCLSYKNDGYNCKNNGKFACVWNENKFGKSYCNTDDLIYVSCGKSFDIPYQIPKIVSFITNLLKIATPIILVIIGMITLLKALASSKEDEIKKAKDSLVKKLIASAMVFLVIAIVQFVILKVADDGEQKNIVDCLTCFLNYDCQKTAYYKTNIAGSYYCTPLNGGKTDICGEYKNLD